jgi:hypothetical protein
MKMPSANTATALLLRRITTQITRLTKGNTAVTDVLRILIPALIYFTLIAIWSFH